MYYRPCSIAFLISSSWIAFLKLSVVNCFEGSLIASSGTLKLFTIPDVFILVGSKEKLSEGLAIGAGGT